MRPTLITLVALLLASPAFALDGTVLLPDGNPAAHATITVAGQNTTTTTDATGRFRLSPSPRPPFTLIIVSRNNLIFPPITFETLNDSAPLVVNLAPAFQETLTVVSGAAPHLDATPGAAATTLATESIEVESPQHVTDAIATIPGVKRSDAGPTAVPSIRGLSRGRTLLLLDGFRLNTERRAGSSAMFVDPFTLDSIEVVRGPASVAYGSDAFGGIVEMRSREPRAIDGHTFRFHLGGEMLGTPLVTTAVDLSQPAGAGALGLQLHWRKAGDGELPDGETLVNSAYEDRGGAVRFASATGGGTLSASLAFNEAVDVERAAIDTDSVRTTYPLERLIRGNFVVARQRAGGWSDIELAASVGEHTMQLERTRPGSGVWSFSDGSDTSAMDGSMRLTARRDMRHLRVHAGADLSSRWGLASIVSRDNGGVYEESYAIEDANRVDAGLFTSIATTLGRFAVKTGFRVDHVVSENSGGWFGDRSDSHTAPSAVISVTTPLLRFATASLQFSSGFRDPTLSDRYYRGPSGRGFVIGNPDLGPERSRQVDASVQWSRGRTSAGVFAYVYRIEELVERYRSGSDFHFRNSGEAEIRGGELEARGMITNAISLEVGLSTGRGELRGSGAAVDDIAPDTFSSTLRYSTPRGYLFVRGAAFAAKDDAGPTEVARYSYQEFNAGAGWRFTPDLELRLLVRNLTNDTHFASADESAAIAPGRSVSIAISGKR